MIENVRLGLFLLIFDQHLGFSVDSVDMNGDVQIVLADIILEELMAEVTRRHGAQLVEDLGRLDVACHEVGSQFGLKAYQASLDLISSTQDDSSAPCPSCEQGTPVRFHDRYREVWTMDGIASLRRNYHYCKACKVGFYPLDIELGFPQQGRLGL